MANYQEDYSSLQPLMFSHESRTNKARKTLAVLKDYFGQIDDKIVLEIGCSTGIITNYFSDYFLKIDGIDIDKKAIEHANLNNKKTNVLFQAVPIEEFKSSKNYDIIVCSHIYEHVPDSGVLLDNIYRLLKPGGVCYFAAGNKFQLMEPHYKLLFLSYFPKSISNLYLKITKKGDFYYENHLSLRNLKKLVSKFVIIDYTLKIINEPSKFYLEDMIRTKGIIHKFIKLFARVFFFFIPTYIWILKK